MEHTDLTNGFMSSPFSTVPAWTSSLSTCHIFFHAISVITFLWTAKSCYQLLNSSSLSASSLHKDSIHNCHLFLTSQHMRKAKAFGGSQDQNHLQQLTPHLIIAFETKWLHLQITVWQPLFHPGSYRACLHPLAACIDEMGQLNRTDAALGSYEADNPVTDRL